MADDSAIRAKLALLRLGEHLGNVSRACAIMEYSRDSYYRFKKLYERGGAEALRPKARRIPIPGNRLRTETEEACVQLALERPSWGQARVARELAATGLRVSPSSVRRVWLRHGLETRKKRLQAVMGRSAQASDRGTPPETEAPAPAGPVCRCPVLHHDF